jgi:hypothetical protein
MSVMTEGDQSSALRPQGYDDEQRRPLRVEPVEPMVATASRQHAIHGFLGNWIRNAKKVTSDKTMERAQ